MLKRVAALAFAALAMPLPVLAGPGTESVRVSLSEGDIDSGLAAIGLLADAGDQAAWQLTVGPAYGLIVLSQQELAARFARPASLGEVTRVISSGRSKAAAHFL